MIVIIGLTLDPVGLALPKETQDAYILAEVVIRSQVP